MSEGCVASLGECLIDSTSECWIEVHALWPVACESGVGFEVLDVPKIMNLDLLFI